MYAVLEDMLYHCRCTCSGLRQVVSEGMYSAEADGLSGGPSNSHLFPLQNLTLEELLVLLPELLLQRKIWVYRSKLRPSLC